MAKRKRRSRQEPDDGFFSLAAFDDGFDELPHRWEDDAADPVHDEGPHVLENRAPNDEALLESERAWESPELQAQLAAEDRERVEDRRRRNRFLVVDLLLVLAIAAVIATVVLMARRNPPQPPVEPFPNLDDLFACCSKVPAATVPNLTALEGDTSEEALAALGPRASLISASVGEDETGTAGRSVTIEREALIGFAPEENTSGADYNSARLRLVQDGSGRTGDISYTVSLDDLGYQNLSFPAALADVGFWRGMLGSAGIPGHDIMLGQPEAIDDTRTMGTNALGTEYVTKESHTFNGTYGSSELYDWSLELLYDHTPEAGSFRSGDTVRTMTIHIAPHVQG